MSDGRLNAAVDQYRHAAAMNVPPPPVTSDPLVAGDTPIEQLLRVLGLAANAGDLTDGTEIIDEHTRRGALTTEAAENFAAQDQQAAAQMAQQIPQMASGIAGALAGALGGALAPVAQIAQQAMQAGLGMVQQGAGLTAEDVGPAADPLPEDFDTGTDDVGDLSDTGGGGGADVAGAGSFDGGGSGEGFGATTPTALLGPPPVPSPGTSPASAPSLPSPAATSAPAASAAGAGMSGAPLIPPAAINGGPGSEREARTDTRRVSVPSVRNGAPVQGRITTVPTPPAVTKRVEGKPVATRRIIPPADADSGDTAAGK